MRKWQASLIGAPAFLIVAVACGLPLWWTLQVIVRHPDSLAQLWLSPFRLKLLGCTLAYNALAALLATALGLPVGWVMGRSRSIFANAMWVLAPASLLLPFLPFGFGWNEAFQITRPVWKIFGVVFSPGGVSDTARCIWTLAAWLWGVPAILVGMALRRLDPDLQLAAWLDGALFRMTFRSLLGPLIVAAAITMVLASQEFAIYEPTGVRVVATEVRMVFATGAFGSGLIAGADQEQRAADAILTAAPLLAVTIALALLALQFARRFSIGTTIHNSEWPPVLNAPRWVSVLAFAFVSLALGVPILALFSSLKKIDSLSMLSNQFGGALAGSGLLFVLVAALAMVLAFSASAYWTPGLMMMSGFSFLLGGEILAIALIRIFNRPGLEWAYDAWPLPMIAYLGRFACVALLAARITWSSTWRSMRVQAAHDGATPFTIARRMVWPLAWPMFGAAALLAGILSFGEVDATATLIPQNPPVMTTLLLTMANASRSNRMIEGSLGAIGLVFASLLLFLAARRAAQLWQAVSGRSN